MSRNVSGVFMEALLNAHPDAQLGQFPDRAADMIVQAKVADQQKIFNIFQPVKGEAQGRKHLECSGKKAERMQVEGS